MTARSTQPRTVEALVIGGSAGSVEALSVILPALRPSCGIAVFVVVHLPRERPSRLVDVFQPKCALRVTEAQDKEPIAPGSIYFAPPDYHLLVDAGRQLALAADELVHFSRPSIDVLFESAADAYARQLIGLVLSGANDDGASGLKTVQTAGGLTLVQSPETAVAPRMPQAAFEATPSSASLSLEQISQFFGGIVAGSVAPDEITGWTQA